MTDEPDKLETHDADEYYDERERGTFEAWCPCGWRKQYAPEHSFDGDGRRSAEQAAKGHVGTCDYEYGEITVAEV